MKGAERVSAMKFAEPRRDHNHESPHHYIHNFPSGFDWVQPSIEVCETGRIGRGLIARDRITKGEVVVFFGGTIMTKLEVQSLPFILSSIPYQISDSLYFGIPTEKDIGKGEMINHSCDPNVGFTSEMRVVAIRDIAPGQEVAMDYATCMWDEDYKLECLCLSKNCRKLVTGNDWRLPDMALRLGRYYQPGLREKLMTTQGAKDQNSSVALK